LTEGLDVFRLGAIATGGRMIPSGNLSFGKRTLIGWMSRLNNGPKVFSPYLKENILIYYKDYLLQRLMLLKEIIAVYSENHMKPINSKCRVKDC
jgi:hypothetical protein